MSAVVLVFGVSALSAQSPWFLSGSIGFNHTKDASDAKITRFDIAPAVGYMLNENWGVTLDGVYSHTKIGDASSDSFGVGVGALYVCKLGEKFFYTPNVRLGYGQSDVAVGTEGATAKLNAFGVNLNVLAFEFRPTTRWGLTLGFGGLQYSNSKVKDADSSTNSFGLNIANTTAVGFKFYF